MDLFFSGLAVCALAGFIAGWALAAGYYAGKVREAFGIEEPRISDWLNTKAAKRRLDAQRENEAARTPR